VIWLRLRVGGQRIVVHLVREAHPKLEGNVGMYLPDECSIYLSSALSTTAREDTLFHELDHAVNCISGANNVLDGVAKGKRLTEIEEQIVRCRTPVWHALLKDMGFRFPKGPHE
jgi:hypothetical protein